MKVSLLLYSTSRRVVLIGSGNRPVVPVVLSRMTLDGKRRRPEPIMNSGLRVPWRRERLGRSRRTV